MCRSRAHFTWAVGAYPVSHIHSRATFKVRSCSKTNAFSFIASRVLRPNFPRLENLFKTSCWKKSGVKFLTWTVYRAVRAYA